MSSCRMVRKTSGGKCSTLRTCCFTDWLFETIGGNEAICLGSFLGSGGGGEGAAGRGVTFVFALCAWLFEMVANEIVDVDVVVG